MKKVLFILSASILSLCINCCEKSLPPPDKYSKIFDYNVLIVPDLSNRINTEIHPKPISDTMLINTLFDSIPSLLKIKNRQMNQMDIYKLDFINRGILNNSIINNQASEINFINFKNRPKEASDYKKQKLKSDISILKNNVFKIYNYSLQNTAGSDVWNYFNQTINSSLIDEKDQIIDIGNNEKIIKNTKNVAVLFTDGYIESANNSAGYTFDQQSIKKIRQEFINSKSIDLEKFIQSKPEYLIKKTSNNLKNVNVLVLEMVDRSLDKNGSTTVQPTDFEIMKIIWTQWLKSSAAAHVEIYPAFSKRTDAYDAVKKFMIEISNN